MLYDVARHPEVQAKIWEELSEIENHTDGKAEEVFSLSNTHQLNWTQAACYETIRMTCSPIVPHRATVDTTLAGNKYSIILSVGR